MFGTWCLTSLKIYYFKAIIAVETKLKTDGHKTSLFKCCREVVEHTKGAKTELR